MRELLECPSSKVVLDPREAERAWPFPAHGWLAVPADVALIAGEAKRVPWGPGDVIEVVVQRGEGPDQRSAHVRVRELHIVHAQAAGSAFRALAASAGRRRPPGDFRWLLAVESLPAAQ